MRRFFIQKEIEIQKPDAYNHETKAIQTSILLDTILVDLHRLYSRNGYDRRRAIPKHAKMESI